MGDDRPVRYIEGDRIIYRASGLGMCDRAIVATGQFYDPLPKPQWFQEILDEGTNAEATISEMWGKKTGIATVESQKEVELHVWGDVWIRAHIDGEAEDDSKVLREFKKVRSSGWSGYLRQGVEWLPYYPWQVAAVMHAGGYESCEFVGGRYYKDEGKVLEVHGHILTAPPIPLLAIRKRIIRLEELIEEVAVPADVPCQINMYPCPFLYLHTEDEEKEAEAGQVNEARELHSDEVYVRLKTEYDEVTAALTPLSAEQRKLTERKRQLTLGLIGWMQAEGVGSKETVTVDGVTVKYVEEKKEAYTVSESTRRQVMYAKVKKSKEQ